jgi:type IV pilus assembly protein PilC
MRFEYRAYAADDPRRELTDVVEAETRADAASMLRRNGFVPIEIKAVSAKKFDPNNIQLGPKKVTIRELALFTRQFSTMIKAGMSPLQSLEVVTRTLKNKWFADSLTDVRDAITSGADLSSALSRHPKIFGALYVSLVKAGEAGGDLPLALDRLATQMETDATIRAEVKSAMVYPVVVLVFAGLILTAMLIFVVPTFSTLFEDTGGELPSLTRYMVNISDVMRKFFYLIPVVIFGIRFSVRKVLSTKKGRYNWDKFKLRMPMKIGPLYQKVVTARFMRTLATLQSSGVPILTALEITAPTANNVIVEEAVHGAISEVKTGSDISKAIASMHIFPDMATAMVQAGEESGELTTMLEKVAETYEEEVSTAIKGLKALMEPIMMMLIGGVVGTVVIALYLPSFKIYDQIK